MKVKNILFVSVVLVTNLIFLFWSAGYVRANEGTIEIGSTTGESYRCFAASMFVNNYQVLVGCRDLIYPSPGAYIMWAVPQDNSKPVKLGALEYGRKQFSINKPFVHLFVTLESNPNANAPSDVVIMRGTIEPVTFLDRPVSPTPAPEEGTPEGEEVKEEGGKKETVKEEGTSTKNKLLTALKRAGVAALFALVALVGLVFVITRARG